MKKIILIGLCMLVLVVINGCNLSKPIYKEDTILENGVVIPSCIRNDYRIKLCSISPNGIVHIQFTPPNAVWKNGSVYDGDTPYCDATFYCG